VPTEFSRTDQRQRRGNLRIFFGASVGVGKTYKMLECARDTRAAGIDVVIGYVETHGRIETERLMAGLERLPSLDVSYRHIIRQEFDLDGYRHLAGRSRPVRTAQGWAQCPGRPGRGAETATATTVAGTTSCPGNICRANCARTAED